MSSELGLSPRVLRLPRADNPESYVLVHITRTGSSLVDLNVTATEGENPYTCTVHKSHLHEFRSKNYEGNDEEWAQIVSHVFGQLDESDAKMKKLCGIESSASIIGASDAEDKELVITIRKRIQTITQRLGSVTLRQDDQQSIQLFDWAGLAAVRAYTLEQRFTSLLARYRSAETMIRQLNKQLEEFVSAKTQHEEQLIVNFVQLLNEKKLKIRNQQRLLATAKVDREKVSCIQNATSDQHLRPHKSIRVTKRTAAEMSDDEAESEAGFETMEFDQTMHSNDSEKANEMADERSSTPQPLEESDENTTDEGSPAPSDPTGSEDERHMLERRGPTGRSVIKELPLPPPRRELPFARKVQTAVTKPKTQAHQQENNNTEDTAGETDDDEL
ncbi:hypothetical protein ANOM_011055 [Aspergillus nomiae NRRL 13137]|uniref:XRCC4 coiled-coil domain-containing protein n=1 Tax=Aspergillus nomiae NRRL (strain ATCC 15546 / NRRL 13137 / CBS 260.88 / M93) TaxID=1509407 RepID=A0A0L1INL7_ASPN3|nr:uncharacterized protein ANOM_011055 [Aspergillus nomiae NRRL 13137]KNG80818.1 hypothetical protein ANOM_011055 [Aspergillus nomiae NRRL 13137]